MTQLVHDPSLLIRKISAGGGQRCKTWKGCRRKLPRVKRSDLAFEVPFNDGIVYWASL